MLLSDNNKTLPEEQDIIDGWDQNEAVAISLICLTYNQLDYIEMTLVSMLSQVCKVRFEIIVHDDASTDGTSDIVTKFASRYPTIIKHVLRKENAFSKGHRVLPLAVAHASGEYIAICEGDDYWIDKDKIQKQYDMLSANCDVNICCHPVHYLENDLLKNSPLQTFDKSKLRMLDIYLEQGGYISTCSLFFKKKVIDELPRWFFDYAQFADFYIQILSSEANGCLYIKETMAVRRLNSTGSWTSSRILNPDSVLKEVDFTLRAEKELRAYCSIPFLFYLRRIKNIVFTRLYFLLRIKQYKLAYKVFKRSVNV
ncbi:glycosyltransferase family 2 protein [Vibrio sp. 1075]|uniref:glycosyltransferase family 2 protein n=1 Tax=Vibrio sp. 1075 TaxID=3074543 RepID=UPI002964C3C7|nr:glycosyltransferase [Vibrio sp. 1075]MDW2309492.1 glycosyltransferase [Vibrio sp. 1075]